MVPERAMPGAGCGVATVVTGFTVGQRVNLVKHGKVPGK
jgi:hypothetical protein